ncbi:MAG: Asp-tRNA(Asn)/Glu-tRNA(Gln) amidotransferase subunit GatB [Halothiobacillaceae bacterium]
MQWETVIGLEIHAQLATKSKIFSGSSTAFGAEPNTQANVVDLGMPGALPVLNAEAVRLAVTFGLAINAVVNRRSIFARKNYFYPDLPKGYQISQMDLPIVARGSITIEQEDGTSKTVGITRAHLEEDAGKSLHEDFHNMTGIDLNRAGTPLLEIVSEPDMRSAKEAVAYAKTIHSLVRHLGMCDGNMQEGSFRVDANVSVRPKGQVEFGTRAEVKNVNSFRFLERAINFEVERQIDALEGGGKVVQETRLYDPDRDETRSMRSKEEAHDYRYFPDPDLLPVVLDEAFIDAVRAGLPELPQEKKQRFVTQYGLSSYDASFLTAERELADFYEAALKAAACEPKLAANWVMGDFSAALNKAGLDIAQSPVDADMLAGLLKRISDNTLSGKLAKEVFEAMMAGEGGCDAQAADVIIEKKGLKQITDEGAIAAIVDAALAQCPEQVAEYRSGKDKVFGFLVGQVMKAAQGKANPAQLNAVLKQRLED